MTLGGWLTFPNDPWPSTLRRSNCSGEAFSQPSLVISLTSNSDTIPAPFFCKEIFSVKADIWRLFFFFFFFFAFRKICRIFQDVKFCTKMAMQYSMFNNRNVDLNKFAYFLVKLINFHIIFDNLRLIHRLKMRFHPRNCDFCRPEIETFFNHSTKK